MRAFLAVAAFLSWAWVTSSHAAPREPRITIDMQDAEVTHVLRLLAEVSQKNFVVGDDVAGRVTLKLKNVPWRVALRVVLQTQQLGAVEEDAVVRVAPLARLDAEDTRVLDRAADQRLRGPMRTKIIPVSHARANDLATAVQALLTPRGTVTVDERTNTLIVRDMIESPALH